MTKISSTMNTFEWNFFVSAMNPHNWTVVFFHKCLKYILLVTSYNYEKSFKISACKFTLYLVLDFEKNCFSSSISCWCSAEYKLRSLSCALWEFEEVSYSNSTHGRNVSTDCLLKVLQSWGFTERLAENEHQLEFFLIHLQRFYDYNSQKLP